jgi:formate transporter
MMTPVQPGKPSSTNIFGIDAYAPAEIAERVENEGVKRAQLPMLSRLMLGVVGGGFIGLGAMFHTTVTSDPTLSIGAAKLVGGVAFAMGYLTAITAGAAVFTTNNLEVMTWAAKRISTAILLRNWGIVLFANAIGAVGLAGILIMSGYPEMEGGMTGRRLLEIGASKAQEPFAVAFFRGVMGNLLIAIGVWIAMAGRSVTDKFIGPLLPIAAVPICNFEHSVGNLYYVPMALMLSTFAPEMAQEAEFAISLPTTMRNLSAVILGNIVGGSVLVALVYHLIYRRMMPIAAPTLPEARLDHHDNRRD